MFNQTQDYLSIFISEQSIKVAQVKSSGVVVKVARRDVSGLAADGVDRELKTALTGFKLKSEVICVIPASVATTKNIEVPSIDPEEIKSIISLQAGRHTPFSRDEILIGHVNLGSYQTNFTKVLLVIVNRNVIKDRLAVLERAGVNIHQVAFAPEGIARFYARALNVRKESSPVGILDVTAHTTNFIIQSRGAAATCRSIPIGISHLSSQGAEARDKLVAEIKTSLDSYKEEDIDKVPDYFVLTSSHKIVHDLQPSLAEILGTPVQVSPFLDFLKIGQALKKKCAVDFADDSLAELIAPALTAARADVNLIPEEIKLKRSVEQKSQQVTQSGALVIVILILVGAILLTKIYFKEAFLKNNLRAKYAGNHEEVLTLEKELQKARMVGEIWQGRLKPLSLLRGLYAIIPNDIYLNTLNIAEDGLISISGIAETTSRVYAFVGSLSESGIFEGVKTKSTSGKKDRGKDMVAFEIELVLKNSVVEGDQEQLAVNKSKAAKVKDGE